MRGVRRGRQTSQVIVVFAITAASMLAVIGLLYSFGLVLIQRRSGQTAADAASLSGTWRVLSELQADSLSDSAVLNAIVTYAQSNGVPSDGTTGDSTYVQAIYVDATGAALSPNVMVGQATGGTFPTNARGVRVTISTNVATVLPGFVRIARINVQDSAAAAARPAATPSQAAPVIPIAVLASDVQSNLSQHTQYDLFASAHFLPNGLPPTLNLASVSAPSSGMLATDMQYWSDGEHESGWLCCQPATVDLANGPYFENIATGLHDNVRRQAASNGAAYALVTVPIYDTSTSTTLHVTAFAQMKLNDSDISSTNAKGNFVPYPAGAGVSTTAFNGTDIGAALVQLAI